MPIQSESSANLHEVVDLSKRKANPSIIEDNATKSKPALNEEQARLENWKRHFPFKPLYHATLKYDPGIYDVKDSSTWGGPIGEEGIIKHSCYRNMVFNHGFLASFHENPIRFSKEFEELYHLLGKFDRNDNAINVAKIFQHLVGYHVANHQKKPEKVVNKTPIGLDQETRQFKEPETRNKENMAWRNRAKSFREGIAFVLFQESEWPSKEKIEAMRAWKWADQIIDAFPAESFLKFAHTKKFAFSRHHERALKPGDSLLIPKMGYAEAFEKYYRKAYRRQLAGGVEDAFRNLVLGDDGRVYDKETGEVFLPEVDPIFLKYFGGHSIPGP